VDEEGVMDRFGVELRAELSGNSLRGHAAVFGVMAELPNHYEQLARSAFDGVLDDDVRALINHDPSKVLGRTSAGTLKISTDETGLYFEIPELPDTSYAKDLRETLLRGDQDSMSFGFIPGVDTWGKAPNGRQVRTHTSLKRLLDVSVVTYPAFQGTDVQLRSMDFSVVDQRSQLIRLRHNALLGRALKEG
jgi:Escherichia/Staphylococcus phage prohead protease